MYGIVTITFFGYLASVVSHRLLSHESIASPVIVTCRSCSIQAIQLANLLISCTDANSIWLRLWCTPLVYVYIPAFFRRSFA